MECGDYERGAAMARGPSAVGVQLKYRARGVVEQAPDVANMDEISYWVHTKRAPCLMNYDNIIKKRNDEACSSHINIKAVDIDPSPRKKTKRKLSLLDNDSVSTGKRQNIYFEVSQTDNRPIVNECKSDGLESDVDFNIKNASVAEKPKRARLQKSNRTRVIKKNKVVTSTPKTNTNTANLRRSLRQAQLNNSHMNNSFEIFNTNGALVKHEMEPNHNVPEKAQKKEMLASGDQNKRHSTQRNKSKIVTNGQLDDYSDVSGFTANYIRSTKVQAGKTPRKLRCKTRHLQKEQTNTVACVNKSVNTGLPEANMLHCSTDSSTNVLNFVTKNSINTTKLDKSTSLLKFMDTGKSKEQKINGKQKKTNLNISFQSQSSGTSRYPKRHRSHTYNQTNTGSNKNCLELNNSDKKENPEKVYRTRSGRNAALSGTQRENSVLVVSNSTEQMSSSNVASPLAKERKKRRPAARRAKKPLSRSVAQKDSLRDKSGFTACFSESDDSVPLIQRKFFC